LKLAQKTKSRFAEVIENEIQSLNSAKTQFALNIKFSITRDDEKQEMERYFKEREPTVFYRNNASTVNRAFRRFIDEVKGEIESWSQRGLGWIVEGVLEAFINVPQYQPFRGAATSLSLQSSTAKKRSSTYKTETTSA